MMIKSYSLLSHQHDRIGVAVPVDFAAADDCWPQNSIQHGTSVAVDVDRRASLSFVLLSISLFSAISSNQNPYKIRNFIFCIFRKVLFRFWGRNRLPTLQISRKFLPDLSDLQWAQNLIPKLGIPSDLNAVAWAFDLFQVLFYAGGINKENEAFAEPIAWRFDVHVVGCDRETLLPIHGVATVATKFQANVGCGRWNQAGRRAFDRSLVDG